MTWAQLLDKTRNLLRGGSALLARWWRERRLALVAVALAVLILPPLVAGGLFWRSATRDLPLLEKMTDYRPALPTVLYDEEGREVARFFHENREMVPIDKIPRTVVNAVVAIEDAAFFSHHGLDYMGIARAFFKNLAELRVAQGGSTITQQLAKSLLLSPERTLTRKVKEAVLAMRIERHFSKDQILEVYLNQIYFGFGSYGIEGAALNHFGKHVWELTLPEAALLAGLPKAPSAYSPLRNPEAATARRNLVLSRMMEEGFISKEERAAAEASPLGLNPRRTVADNPNYYFSEEVRRYLVGKYGEETVYTGGLRVVVTVDQEWQAAAQEAVRSGLRELDKRQGFRGPLERVPPGGEAERIARLRAENGLAPAGTGGGAEEQGEAGTVPALAGSAPFLPGQTLRALVTAVADGGLAVDLGGVAGFIPAAETAWTTRGEDPDLPIPGALQTLKPGDVVLARYLRPGGTFLLCGLDQEPMVQGALVCLEAQTGKVRALVGGGDFRQSQFNRATQARRQPGSAFKPVVYSAAIDNGFTPSSVIMDSPIIFDDPSQETTWKPSNFEDRFHGPTTLRTALVNSRNVVTVKVAQSLGIDIILDYAGRFGLDREMKRDFSVVLGSLGVTPVELTAAYTVFATDGERSEPWSVVSVSDRDGQVLERGAPSTSRVLPPDTAFIMQNLLRGVVQNGTGWRAKAIGRPSGGKTGTTNEQMDAWYVGFTPELVAGVWVGFDQKLSMGGEETGSRAAAPIWVTFMQEVVKELPPTSFPPPPPGIEMVKVEPKTGLLALPGASEFIHESFKAGTAPRDFARPGRGPAGSGADAPDSLPWEE